MLRLGRERGAVRVVDDQRCCPSFAGDVADAMLELARTDSWGLYHTINAGETTWYEFAKAIFEGSGMEVELTPITTAEFGAAARRPAFSVLDCAKLETLIGRGLPPWRESLAKYLAGI
jgi:dTDP-4-dehydrorhamnose reductase